MLKRKWRVSGKHSRKKMQWMPCKGYIYIQSGEREALELGWHGEVIHVMSSMRVDCHKGYRRHIRRSSLNRG